MHLDLVKIQNIHAARNAPCHCNSGRRYKHCCGALESAPAPSRRERDRQAALLLQRQHLLPQAVSAYDAILEQDGGDWEVAHMRAVSLYQLGLMHEAREAFIALLATPAVQFAPFWTNLGLLFAAVCNNELAPDLHRQIAEYRQLHAISIASDSVASDKAENQPGDGDAILPSVSVVLPVYQHRDYVAEAIASVFAQTVAPLELIVIDDGSTDGSAEICRARLVDAPFPVSFVARENRGATATLNQGIDMAKGDFIQLLNSDDRLPEDRIAGMLRALLARNADWGYGRVDFMDRNGLPLARHTDPRVAALTAAQDAALMTHTRGLALLRANSAISSGNLMFRKSLWQTLGGFHDYRYNHDWDFCLRASLHSEPMLVPQALYQYRIHASNTIAESAAAPHAEQRKVMAAFVALAQSRPQWPNRFAPTLANWGEPVLAHLGASEGLAYLPAPLLIQALHAPLPSSLRQVAA